LILISKNAFAYSGCVRNMDAKKIECSYFAGELNGNNINILKNTLDQYDKGIQVGRCFVYYAYIPDYVDKNKNFLHYIQQITIKVNDSLVCKLNDIIDGGCMVYDKCNSVDVQYYTKNQALDSFVKTLPIIIHERF
ncbi:MAG: hypothetical protein OXC48_12100, partial [Endozoicomonadaceae bacterium]|nr:hypothetical protein [Endozoicomonadaceae bacterium]